MQKPHNGYTFSPLDSKLQVEVVPPPSFEKIPSSFSDELFEKLSRRKSLFEGSLVCLHKLSEHRIETYTLSYVEYLASKHYPNYPHQHIPLAVSGWVLYRDAVLMGKRSTEVAQFSNSYELVPSGGMDHRSIENQKVNFKEALLIELHEETQIDLKSVLSVEPKALVFCKASQVYDICQSIVLDPSQEVSCEEANAEYSELFWLPIKELREFVLDHHKDIIPTSLALIHHHLLT